MRPTSLYRASVFSASPPTAGGEGRARLGWFGWDQHVALLLEIRNMLAGRQRIEGPPTSEPGVQVTGVDYLRSLRVKPG